MTLKAIETRYKGYRFRSRLEARWAVFFDALGVEYQYEPQGFDLGGVWYLPDFYLPDSYLWVEVKAAAPLSDKDGDKVLRFSKALDEPSPEQTRDRIIVLYGEPYRDMNGEQSYSVGEHWGDNPFAPGILYARRTFIDCVVCNHVQVESEPQYSHGDISYMCQCCDYGPCRGGTDDASRARWHAWFSKGMIYAPAHCDPAYTPRLRAAYVAARSARFEHGDSP